VSKTFKVSREFVLHKLWSVVGTTRPHQDLDKRLPAEVELNQEFVQAHALDIDWIMAMERLLEGEHLTWALARESEADEAMCLASEKLSEEFRTKPLTSQGSLDHEKAIDKLWAQYSRAQADAFTEEAVKQGGWEVGRGKG
jgi:hypothetical protein